MDPNNLWNTNQPKIQIVKMKFLSASRMLLISPYAVTFFQQNSSPVLSSGDWKLDPEDLASKFNSKTKAIVVNNPNNPLGKVLKHFIHFKSKMPIPFPGPSMWHFPAADHQPITVPRSPCNYYFNKFIVVSWCWYLSQTENCYVTHKNDNSI